MNVLFKQREQAHFLRQLRRPGKNGPHGNGTAPPTGVSRAALHTEDGPWGDGGLRSRHAQGSLERDHSRKHIYWHLLATWAMTPMDERTAKC